MKWILCYVKPDKSRKFNLLKREREHSQELLNFYLDYWGENRKKKEITQKPHEIESSSLDKSHHYPMEKLNLIWILSLWLSTDYAVQLIDVMSNSTYTNSSRQLIETFSNGTNVLPLCLFIQIVSFLCFVAHLIWFDWSVRWFNMKWLHEREKLTSNWTLATQNVRTTILLH